jgi:hypothetical protein
LASIGDHCELDFRHPQELRADPLTALVIAAVAIKEERESWRGEGCDCC